MIMCVYLFTVHIYMMYAYFAKVWKDQIANIILCGEQKTYSNAPIYAYVQ